MKRKKQKKLNKNIMQGVQFLANPGLQKSIFRIEQKLPPDVEKRIKAVPTRMILEEYSNYGIFFGLSDDREDIVGVPYGEEGHVLVVSSSGGGKSMCIAGPTTLRYPSSMVILDLKGDLLSYYLRNNVGPNCNRKCTIFAPGRNYTHYDLYSGMQYLKDDDDDETKENKANNNIKEARIISFALIPDAIGDQNPFWNHASRSLLEAIILYSISQNWDFAAAMIWVFSAEGRDLLKIILESECDEAKAAIRDLDFADDKEFYSIMTTLKNDHLSVFCNDSDIINALKKNSESEQLSWDCLDSDERPIVFLEIDQERMSQWSGVMRVIVSQLAIHLIRRPEKYSEERLSSVLLLLDEFPLLGKMDIIVEAVTTLRSKNVSLCMFVQSLAQLDGIYGKDLCKIIVDNCKFKVLLTISEPDTQEYFSKAIGGTVVESFGLSLDEERRDGAIVVSSNFIRRPIVYPEELATNKGVLILSPFGFIKIKKATIDYNKVITMKKWIKLMLLRNLDFDDLAGWRRL